MNFWDRSNYNSQNSTYDQQQMNNAEDAMKEKLNQYGNKSEDQLMNELSAMVARMKKEGTFDPAAMENLFNTASPFLNDEQKQRMRAIIDMFKG